MDPVKVSAAQDWATPKSVKDVQGFIGFANFYRRFIFGYSTICVPMTPLTRKDVKLIWTPTCQESFDHLTNAFCSTLVLMHFDPDKPIIMETDVSDFVSAAVMSQHDDTNILRPVPYFSKKHLPAECNSEIYDKKLLPIIQAFEEWRAELESTISPVSVITDHRNLEYFMTNKFLNRQLGRWSEFVSCFNFIITNRPTKQRGKPDALTRRLGDLAEEGDERVLHQCQSILKRENLDPEISEAKLSLF